MLGSLITGMRKGVLYRNSCWRKSPYKSELGIAFQKGTHRKNWQKKALTETLTEIAKARKGLQKKKIVTKYGWDCGRNSAGGRM